MKAGDFQYSYRLWVEDSDGFEVQLEQPIVQPGVTSPAAGSAAFYRELVKKTPRGYKCYELYTLYLGILSVNVVANHERKLIGLLNPNRKTYDK